MPVEVADGVGFVEERGDEKRKKSKQKKENARDANQHLEKIVAPTMEDSRTGSDTELIAARREIAELKARMLAMEHGESVNNTAPTETMIISKRKNYDGGFPDTVLYVVPPAVVIPDATAALLDWTCSKCSNKNFASRLKCRTKTCNQHRPQVNVPVSVMTAAMEVATAPTVILASSEAQSHDCSLASKVVKMVALKPAVKKPKLTQLDLITPSSTAASLVANTLDIERTPTSRWNKAQPVPQYITDKILLRRQKKKEGKEERNQKKATDEA